jgi:RHS repeat-associated protein
MVWAGDQLLWEIRQPSESPGENITSGGSYGTVSYTHAGGIDRPLVITKDGVSILPHQNWRGQFSSGTYANGARSDCPPGVTTNCIQIAWPGYRTTAWHHDVKEPDIRAWWGGLVDGMRDVSGQQYMRNRYYDPATGQFTQPDPIGIAGGLNSYGFAAGDPVSYSDPYGLKVEFETQAARRSWLDLQRMITQGGNSRDSEQRAAAFRLGLVVHGIQDSDNTFSLHVGRQGGLRGLQVRNRFGGAMTYMPWRGLFNNDARTLIDPQRVRTTFNISAVVALGHEIGHAHAIMNNLRDKASPAVSTDNDTRILAGCLPLRTSEQQWPPPCN